MKDETKVRKLTIRGEASLSDKGALICDAIMLGISAWNQIYYGMDMLFLIIPLTAIGIYLVLFGIIPETYCFVEGMLQITHRFRKTVEIPYESVFNYEAKSHDTFINITQSNLVKVYYLIGTTKAVAICRPRDVDAFVEALKENCNEFHRQSQKNSLSVFFDN